MAGRRSDAEATVNCYLDRLIATDDTVAIPTIRAFQARLAVARGEMASALHWLRTTPVPGAGGSTHEFEVPLLTRAKVLLAEGSLNSLDEANVGLNALLRHAEAVHSIPLRIAALAHRSLVARAQGHSAAALATIADALALAEPCGFFRTFVDLGAPMAALLDLNRQLAGASPLAARLIAVILRPAASAAPVSPADVYAARSPAFAAAPLVEPLTERERDVLDGLAKRLSNKEIAEELAISPHTIKRHTANIYGKLGVSSRRQAVRFAMATGLVTAD